MNEDEEKHHLSYLVVALALTFKLYSLLYKTTAWSAFTTMFVPDCSVVIMSVVPGLQEIMNASSDQCQS